MSRWLFYKTPQVLDRNHNHTKQLRNVKICLISWTTFVLRSPALRLECDNGLTADSFSVVELCTSAQRATVGLSLAGAATATVEREWMIGHARHENCHIHTLSMTCPYLPVDGRVRLYSLQNTLKHFIHLRSSSKSVTVTAWFATWNPAHWHENQIEIRSKTPLIPQTLRTCAELVAS